MCSKLTILLISFYRCFKVALFSGRKKFNFASNGTTMFDVIAQTKTDLLLGVIYFLNECQTNDRVGIFKADLFLVILAHLQGVFFRG